MKQLFILIFCLAAQAGLTQVVTDPNVVKTYERTVKKLSIQYQQKLKETDHQHNQTMGLAIFTMYNIDTLNKKQAIDKSKIHITISNPGDKEGKKQDITYIKEQNTYLPIPCTASLKGDTLILAVLPYVNHHIVKNKVISTYEEYQKGDTIFRLSLSQPGADKLNIPVKTLAFKLSTNKLKAGQVIYGEVEFETSAYYVSDPDFKSNQLNKRLHCKYVFKTIIFDLHNPPK